ncbi:MAG: cation:proton antiporter [Betaproteobacteria bacterium]|nr:MAG: cation:proton antiporter [Betaproteobacteria bacterium]
MSPFDLSVLLFLQLTVIVAACRAGAWLFRWLGQPPVVSEMISGVILGPSLLGWMFPAVSAYLFPPESRAILFSLAQLGLALYMFVVGVEFDLALIAKRLRSAAAVSAAGVLVPFALGGMLALAIADNPLLFSSKTTSTQAVLFMGAAMSITAFPMLARIILENGLTKTSLGTLVLAAGAFDDVAAWSVLAIVLASFQDDMRIAALAVGGSVVFALVVLIVVRRAMLRFGQDTEATGVISGNALATVVLLLMFSAWYSDVIQVYAVFGAFVLGLAMPRGKFAAELQRTFLPLTTVLLLPCFFVYSGLNTKITLVDSAALWLLAGVILLVATLGKGVACYTAARLSGEPHREAAAIGSLMNARGLMELIILNIGLQRGIIEPTLFTIMVMMAIATTLMATPLFRWFYR